jgi:hypothetical protein
VHDESATPKDRARSLTRRATAATAWRSSPRSAAPPAGGVQRVLHRDVVIDQHRLDLHALVGRVLGRQLEVEHVTGVVLDDVHDAGAGIDGLGGGQHLIGHR